MIEKKLNFTTAAFLGDSLTDLTPLATEPYYLHLGIKKTFNLGISGSTIGSKFDCMAERFEAIPNEVDLICIFAGINDFGRNQPLGLFTDRTVETTYGALHTLLAGIKTRYPKAQILFISPFQIGKDFFNEVNSFGLKQEAYMVAIEEVTDYYQVDLLNLYREGRLNLASKTDKDRYSVDSLHLNNLGHAYLATRIYEHLMPMQ